MTERVIAGRYNLQHPIGRGAMGVVWRARDQLLDREVAIKEVVITALIGADERHNAYQRTLREARTAARLSHRGVVAVYDVAEEDGRPWIVMELVPSRSLDQVLTEEGRLTAARTGRIGQQLLSALAAAHAAGVLHRDVKPSNVLIANDRAGDVWDERAVLTDFGIAQFEGDPRLTQTGMVMGSPGFTAPERIRGGDAAPASDLWSLGATLYAAVEGRGPYESRGGAITTMSAIINEDAPAAPHAGRLAPLISALLRRDPATRPSALTAARMFADVLPRLTDPAESPAPAHPPTALASFAPSAASPSAKSADGHLPSARGAAIELGEVTVPATDGGPAPAASEAAEERDEQAAEAVEPAAVVAEAGPARMGPAGVTIAEGALAETPAADTPAAEQPPAGHLAVPSRRETTVPAEPGPKPAQPKPSFTAAKPNERATPTFSAASPVRPPQPSRPYSPPQPKPQPQPDPYPGYSAAGGAGAGYQETSYQSPVGPGGGQYAGPVQPYPDLSQYAPGASGGRAGRGRRRRWIAWLAAIIVLAAAIGIGAWLGFKGSTSPGQAPVADTQTKFGSVNALNDSIEDPPATIPTGWTRYTVAPGETKTSAGFSIAVPPGFKETREGPRTVFDGPGDMQLSVDLTAHKNHDMFHEVQYLDSTEHLPGYGNVNKVGSVPVLRTKGALWQYTYTSTSDKVTLFVDDILFNYPASAGQQAYTVYIHGPQSGWTKKYLPQFDDMLQTFKVVQGS